MQGRPLADNFALSPYLISSAAAANWSAVTLRMVARRLNGVQPTGEPSQNIRHVFQIRPSVMFWRGEA